MVEDFYNQDFTESIVDDKTEMSQDERRFLQNAEEMVELGNGQFPRVLSASSMKKYPDRTTFVKRSLFSVLTVSTTKSHCTMENIFSAIYS